MGVSLFSQVVTGQEEMASNCSRKGLDWILGKKIFIRRVVKHWNRLLSSLPLELFKRCVDEALWDMVSYGLGSAGFMVRLNDLRGICVLSVHVLKRGSLILLSATPVLCQ